MRAAAVTGSENGAADGATSDPWFAPGPKVLATGDALESADGAAYLDSAGAAESAGAPEPATATRLPEAAADPAATAEWFLPTGRAGLLPDSMTVSSEEDQSDRPRAEHPARIPSAGAPPWAGEATEPTTGTPPPWETGPWPGPGGDRTSRKADARAPGGAAPGGTAAANGWPAAAGARQRPPGRPQASGPWSARTILATGLVPLVIPGLIAGVFGFRRSPSGGPVRRASILAISASLAWAIIIVVLVASNSGGSARGCVYPTSVHQAYAQVTADLSANPGAAQQVADLGVAASRANASAAATATGDISVRSALFALAGDLQQARADVAGGRRVSASLRARLAADGTALTAACPS
jgi:hypothetical protein